jgi:hypothetical protein
MPTVQQKYRISWPPQSGVTPAVNRALGTQLANVDEDIETLFTEVRRLRDELETLRAEVTVMRQDFAP